MTGQRVISDSVIIDTSRIDEHNPTETVFMYAVSKPTGYMTGYLRTVYHLVYESDLDTSFISVRLDNTDDIVTHALDRMGELDDLRWQHQNKALMDMLSKPKRKRGSSQ
ncbi:hypothetical protein [Brevundimonas olei]|uniref:hypothetical protein n=1 Tax=Brevundimonas olei TaxID=657642 RepID=UPI0031D1644C